MASTSRDCEFCEIVRHSKIKVDDPGSSVSAVFLNPSKVKHKKHKMDGGHLKNTKSADWMLSKFDVGDVIIELKGCDVAKAIEQIIETAKFAAENNMLQGRVAGLVVCTQYPKISTKIQRLSQDFSKKYNGPIKVKCKSAELAFEDALRF